MLRLSREEAVHTLLHHMGEEARSLVVIRATPLHQALNNHIRQYLNIKTILNNNTRCSSSNTSNNSILNNSIRVLIPALAEPAVAELCNNLQILVQVEAGLRLLVTLVQAVEEVLLHQAVIQAEVVAEAAEHRQVEAAVADQPCRQCHQA